MGRIDRLQRWLLLTGIIIVTILLVKFALDFSAGMPIMLVLPFWLLVGAAISVGLANVFVRPSAQGQGNRAMRGLLLAAIPSGFLASALDCTGLSWEGCTSYCTFIKLAWIPLLALGCAAYFYTRKSWMLAAITAMAYVPLLPHCLCYNVGNGWWIDRLGASPVCYAWGFTATVIAVGALRSGARLWPSLAVCGAIIAGAFAFFISHHYLHFPW
ncbi:MAG TPA: hypothetical protein VNO70_17570 [Blastocatellia bacterium]|nr:hypothetical protein [Blastocatellia bacterium]